MRYLWIILFAAATVYSQWFNGFFQDSTLRIDYFHTGTQHQETLQIDQYYLTPTWPGNPNALLDTLNRGHYFLRVLDARTQRLIYSYGYSTLFNEWQTTDEAHSGVERTFHETIRIPFPKHPVVIEIVKRDRQNIFRVPIATWYFDPASEKVNTERRSPEVETIPLLSNGDPHHHVDLVILGDGYLADEKETFLQTARSLVDTLLAIEPYASRRNDFNITALFLPSHERGTDDPRRNIYRNTVLNTTFNTFNLQRYLMTTDNRTLQDVASAVPWDAMIILVNTAQYGGGGIYNLYACTAANNQYTPYVFVHELGHSFAGLGDEYYTSNVTYNEFYPPGVEPWEPNITALLNPPKVKWQKFVTPGVPIPTPWDKTWYDQLTTDFRKKMQHLQGQDHRRIGEWQRKYRQQMRNFFRRHPYRNVVGAFEGAGYASTGLYRPALDCIMFSRTTAGFDPVCRNAIDAVINHLTK